MEIIPYNSNYTLSYQVFFSPSFFPEKSKVVQNYSTNLFLLNQSKVNSSFFWVKDGETRWQVDNEEEKDFLNIHSPGPPGNKSQWTFMWVWVPMLGSLLGDKSEAEVWRSSILGEYASLGDFMGISRNQWWKGFYCGYCTKIHSTHTELLQPQRQVSLVSG